MINSIQDGAEEGKPHVRLFKYVISVLKCESVMFWTFVIGGSPLDVFGSISCVFHIQKLSLFSHYITKVFYEGN